MVSVWPVAWVRLRYSREAFPGRINKGTYEVTGCAVGDVRAVQLSIISFLNINLLNRYQRLPSLEGSGAGLTLATAWALDMVRFEGLLIVVLLSVSRTLGSSACDLGALSSPGSRLWCACFLHPMLPLQTDVTCQEDAPQQDHSAHTVMHMHHRIPCYTGGTLRHESAPQTSVVGLT